MVAAAVALLPIVAIRFRDRAVGAGLGVAAVVLLATQFVSAVMQIDGPVPSAYQLSGVLTTGKLTVWFTVDVLAALVLLVVLVLWATIRVDYENSPASFPRAPEARRDAIPWGS